MIEILVTIIVLLICIVIYLILQMKKKYQKGINDTFELFLAGAYEARVNWFKTANKYMKNRPAVFVGDSITQEFMLTEMFNGYNVCNRGIGGDTTLGILKRMNESIYDVNPSQLFLMIGTNDIELHRATSEEIVNNIKVICEKTLNKIPDIKINLVSLTPVGDIENPRIDKSAVGTRTNELIDEINHQLKDLSETLHVNYIDVNHLLKDDTNHIHIDYTREGLHLSPKGYEKIVEVYEPYLK